MYSWALRPLLFRLSPGAAHALAFAGLAPLEHVAPLRALVRAAMVPPLDERVAVRVMGLLFPSPVGLAGGFDKDVRRVRALAALGFGHLEVGTVTAHAQAANPEPNLFRLPVDRALINRLGFPNHGAERAANRLRKVIRGAGVPVGISIGKSRDVSVDDLDAVIADYVTSFDLVRNAADFVVVNVSSPNTAGLRTMQDRGHALALLSALAGRGGGASRLLVKVAPDLSDAGLEDLLSVVEEVGLTGVVATNTTMSRAGLLTHVKHVEAVGAGGLSGPPLRTRAVEVVRRVRARLGRNVVIVGVGGVERAEHAMALVRAGANLVQMYTGFIYEGPGTPARIARDIEGMLRREGIASIADLVGADAR